MSSNIEVLLQKLEEIEERKKRRKSDNWDKSDDQIFIESIKTQLNCDKLTINNTQNIDWHLVSIAVKRSAAKCKKHWFSQIRLKMINEDMDDSANCWHHLYDSARLIECIYSSNYVREEDIDWDFLKEKFANIASFNNLLRIWRNLKTSVPNYNTKTFREIINWLWNNKMPNEIVLSDDE